MGCEYILKALYMKKTRTRIHLNFASRMLQMYYVYYRQYTTRGQ